MKLFTLAIAVLAFSSFIVTPVGATPQKSQIDTKASSITWHGKKVTGQHDGTIQLASGDASLDGGQLVGGHFVVDMASIKDNDLTDAAFNTKLTTHLKSDDFFDVQKFPHAEFTITSVKALAGAASGQPNFQIMGDLKIKDKTNSVSFPAVITSAAGKTQATGHIVIDRTKWGIKYGSGKFFTGLGDHLIYDEFSLDLNLVTQ